MRDFARPRGRLAALPLLARITYSIFLAFAVAGFALSAWLTEDMVGLTLERFDGYYAGTAADEAAEPTSVERAGPVLDLPIEADLPPASEPIPLRKLLEVTHFHLFSMPVYLLILSHLFMLSGVGDRTKLTWILVASASTGAHMLAPWLARATSPAGALFYATSGALLAASYLVMTCIPLWEMWRLRRR